MGSASGASGNGGITGFRDAISRALGGIADAVDGNGVAAGPGNPDQRTDDSRDNSSGGPSASPDQKREAPVRPVKPAPTKEEPTTSAPTAEVPRPGPAPVKKKTLLTDGGLARPTLGGVAKTLLGS